MARITVEDCLKKVPSRFLLVNMVARRVRQIREGSEYLVSSPKNEDIVVSLREIAAGKIKAHLKRRSGAAALMEASGMEFSPQETEAVDESLTAAEEPDTAEAGAEEPELSAPKKEGKESGGEDPGDDADR